MKTNSDTNSCPLCHQENQCAIAANKNPANCWCMTETIQYEQLPKAIREQAQCICYTCAMQLTTEE